MWALVDFYDTRLTMGLRPRVSDASAVESSQKCSMGGRQAGTAKWLEILFSMAFILATNRKRETHFDYNADLQTLA